MGTLWLLFNSNMYFIASLMDGCDISILYITHIYILFTLIYNFEEANRITFTMTNNAYFRSFDIVQEELAKGHIRTS